MNEAETRAELIDPALKAAGWGVVEGSRVRREVLAPGRLLGNGRRAKSLKCDYVLTYRGKKLAAMEAKRRDLGDTDGVGQAKDYAQRLRTRFAFSTNGLGIYRIDMATGAEGHVDAYPSPNELWQATYPEKNVWRDRFGAVPFEDKGGQWELRYYQHNAIEAALEAIQAGQRRILLTLATGAPARPPSPSRSPGSCSRAAGTCPESRRGARASCSSPTATSSPIRRSTPSPPSPMTRWCGSTRTRSARKGGCRKTPPSSSPFSRPS